METKSDAESDAPNIKQCAACRLVIPATAKFCLECGATQKQEKQTQTKDAQNTPEAKTQIRDGASIGLTNSADTAFRNTSPNVILFVTVAVLVLGGAVHYAFNRIDNVSHAKSYSLQGLDQATERTPAIQQQIVQAPQPAPPPKPSFPKVKLITEDAHFQELAGEWGREFFNPTNPNDPAYTYSKGLTLAKTEADSDPTVTSLSDPELRAAAWQQAFEKAEKRHGGAEYLSAEVIAGRTQQLREYLIEHRDDAFEIAAFYDYDESTQVLELKRMTGHSLQVYGMRVKVGISDMDGAFSRFEVVGAQVLSQMPLVYARRNNIILAAQGDLATQGESGECKLRKLLLVDRDSGTVLSELKANSLLSCAVNHALVR